MRETRKELIAEMWENGKSSGEIANILEITRGTVMGVIHRLKAKGKVFHKISNKTVTIAQIPKKEKPMVKKPKLKVFKPEPETIEIYEGGITIFDLTSRSCRYILGPVDGEHTRYCGEPKSGKSYCRKHRSLCYYILKPKLNTSHNVGDTKRIGDRTP